MAMSIVDFASPMKLEIRLATSAICAVRSGVGVNGSRPCCWRSVTSMAPSANDAVSAVIGDILSKEEFCRMGSGYFRRVARRPRPAVQAALNKLVPRSLGIVGVGEKIEVGRCNHPFVHQRREIDDASPIRLPDENDGNSGHLGGLHQR